MRQASPLIEGFGDRKTFLWIGGEEGIQRRGEVSEWTISWESVVVVRVFCRPRLLLGSRNLGE